MMILLIDIGNTLTKVAYAEETSTNISFVTSVITNSTKWEATMKKIVLTKRTKIKNVVICSVVPKKLALIKELVAINLKFKPIIVNFSLLKMLPLKIASSYQEIGSDLISLAIASHQQFGDSITISLGTATTYVVIKDDTLKGVIIGPGLTGAKISLSENAAQIKPFNITKYQSVLGNSTNHALSIGYGNGFNYMIDETSKAINKELKTNLKIIITGGSFIELQPFLTFNYHYHENLVLHGLIIIYQILKKNNKLK